MYENIPSELKLVPHWVMWKYETINDKKTKVPYSIKGYKAAVNNPDSWCGFFEAVEHAQFYDGIGFVLTKSDPYAFIDLDHTENEEYIAKQRDIFSQFGDTYMELSPSGRGLHIIAKASVPCGRKKAWLEIYSDNRFMTMTGNVYNRQPIVDANSRFNNIHDQLGERPLVLEYDVDAEERYTDEQVLHSMFTAVNRDKVEKLWNGDYQDYYTSQSEADCALVNIISFYSRNREQIKRLFHQSALGQRVKAHRSDYLERLIIKSFDNKLPEININNLKENIHDSLREFKGKGTRLNLTVETAQIFNTYDNSIVKGTVDNELPITEISPHYTINLDDEFPNLPDGLVKDIAKFIYQQSPRPNKDISQLTALAFLSGICGRSYNISGTGLNAYYVLLAMSGLGKEAMLKGVEKLIAAVLPMQPQAHKFLGLSELVSGQGLMRYIAEQSNCFLTIQGEFAHLMQRMTMRNAPAHMLILKKLILDLYNKSGQGNKLQGVAYSDTKNNLTALEAPALTILGESVPETFYQTLSEGLAEEGLISRLIIWETHAKRPPMNHNHSKVKVPDELKNHLQILMSNALTMNALNKVVDVGIEPDVAIELDKYDDETNKLANVTYSDVKRQLITRNHLKIMKLAALFAIGDNLYTPKINMKHFEFARNFIDQSTDAILRKYDLEEIGDTVGSNNKQIQDLELLIGEVLINPKNFPQISGFMENDFVIPHKLINDRAKIMKSFRLSKHPNKNTQQLVRDYLYGLIEDGRLVEIPSRDMLTKYNCTGKGYIVAEPTYFIRLFQRFNPSL